DEQDWERRRVVAEDFRLGKGVAKPALPFLSARILCLVVALLLILFVFVLAPVVGIAGAAGSFEGASAGLGIMQAAGCLSNLLMLATPLLGGTGSLLCFWVPEKAQARVLVIVSFGLEVGGAGVMVLGFVLALTSGGSGSLTAAGSFSLMPLLGGLVSLAGFILFMLFLRALAVYLRDEMSADEAVRQLIMFLAVVVGGGLVMFILGYVL